MSECRHTQELCFSIKLNSAPVLFSRAEAKSLQQQLRVVRSRFDAEELKTRLVDQGLQPRRDAESFHVRDPDGLDVQAGDRGLGLSTGIVETGFKLR